MTGAQRTVFWCACVFVFGSALALGANRPQVWVFLCLSAMILFGVQIVLDAATPPERRVVGLAIPGVLYVGAVAWAAIQTAPAPMSGWGHEAWAYVGVASAISVDPVAGWHRVARLCAYAALFFIAAAACKRARTARAFIDVAAVWSFLVAVYAISAHFSGWNPILGDAEADVYGDVLEGPFINRNAYAFYAAMGAMLNMASFSRRMSGKGEHDDEHDRRRASRDAVERFFSGGWLFLAGLFACVAAVLLTQSRAGALVTLMGLGVFLGLYFRSKNGFGRGAWLALGLGIIALAASMADGVATRAVGQALANDGRLEIFKAAYQAILERPMIGYGFGAFSDAFSPYSPQSLASHNVDLAHSTYVENAFELGIPAALALCGAIGYVALGSLKGAYRRRRMLEAPCLAFAVAVAAGAHALVDFSLQMPATAAFFALIMGVGWAQRRSSRIGAKQPS